MKAFKVARTGLEPVTFGLSARRANTARPINVRIELNQAQLTVKTDSMEHCKPRKTLNLEFQIP